MLNSISGRSDFYSRYGALESTYGRSTSVQSAGLSSRTLEGIQQLSAIDRIAASNLRLSNLNSLNNLSNDFLQKRTGSSTVSLSAPAKLQSSLSTLNSALNTLSSAAVRNPLRATTSDSTVATATALQGGEVGVAKNIVVQQLAQGQLSQSANLASQTDALGAGRITIQFGAVQAGIQQQEGRAVSIEVLEGDTLSDVARKIEKAQPALKARVISDQDGASLQLESVASGAGQAFTVQATTAAGDVASGNLGKLTIDATAAQLAPRRAQDAQLQIDGRDIRSASNSVTDTSSNLKLELRQAGTASLATERDGDGLRKNVQQFIERLNLARSQLKEIDSQGNSALALGSGLAKKEIARLDGVISQVAQGLGNERVSLADLGITTASDGRLIVNETRLSQQILAKPEAVNNVLNLALDQVAESSRQSERELTQLNQPFQQLRANANQRTSGQFGMAGYSLLDSGGASGSLRGFYGIAQYLQVAQFQ